MRTVATLTLCIVALGLRAAESPSLKLTKTDPDTYQLRERIATRTGARTAFFLLELGELYLAAPHAGTHPAEIRVFQPRD